MSYLEMKNVTVKFPGVIALNNFSFDVKLGELHVLLGENGAGKSTLVKVLSGINTPVSGEIKIGDRTFHSLSPRESRENKIAVIYQELSVIDSLSIAENMFSGRLPTRKVLGVPVIDQEYMNCEAEKYLQQIGVHRKPSTLVSELSISEKQEVEIAKALSAQAKIVIMDEPTSSLSIDETENLFRIIRKLKEQNIAIIYISHKLQEIKQIGDRVTVMKDGKYVKTVNVADIETRDLVPLMIGREVKNSYLNENTAGFSGQPAIFEVRNLTRKDGSCNNISFQVHTGEILGFSGLIGAGRSECMEGIFGARPISSGEVFLRGKKLRIRNPYDAMKKGIAFVTENRRETGFFPNFQIWKEIAVSTSLKRSTAGGFSGLVQEDRERKTAGEYVKRLNIKCTGPDQMTYTLSGGNQQKVIVSKWLAADSDVMIFDEPTKGIDVGAKSEIYAIMRNLADEGKAILMVSSELPELLSICDRIIVFRDGSISGEFLNIDATEEKLMMAAVDA